MAQKYALRTEEAIAKSREHCRDVIAALPKIPLHEIPFSELLRTTSAVLSKHPDFKPIKICKVFDAIEAVKNGQSQYAHYEIGNRLVLERVVSKLVAERRLRVCHAKLFRTVLGELYYNPPVSVAEKQERALEQLNEKLGTAQTEELILHAAKVWHENQEGYASALEQMPLKERQLVVSHIADSFGNPLAKHWFFSSICFNRGKFIPDEVKNPLDAALATLGRMQQVKSAAYDD